MPLSRYGSGKPSCAFSLVAKAKSRAMRSAFVGIFLAAKIFFDILFIFKERPLDLENIAFQGAKNRHVDDSGASLTGTLGSFIDLAQQIGRNG